MDKFRVGDSAAGILLELATCVARLAGNGNAFGSIAPLLTFAAPVPPYRSERFSLPLGWPLSVRMQSVRHAGRLEFSTARESRAGRPKSSPLPETQSQQMPGQVA